MGEAGTAAPRVAVIIVSWNVERLLAGCLGSLAEQGVPLQIVVVDNGSTDASAALVRRDFPAATLLETGANLGFGRANNLGASHSGAELLLFLNPDTVVHPGAIAALVAFLDAHPQAGLVAPRLLNPDGSLQRAAFRFPGLAQTALDLFPLHPRLMDSPLNGRYQEERTSEEPFRIDHPLGAAMMIRRTAFEQVGGFDEGFFMYAEEVDLCLRLADAGWESWQAPAARVTHFGGQSTGQVRAGMYVELWKARQRFYRLHYTPAFRAAAGAIVRAGMLRKALATRLDEQRGLISHEQARELRRAYGKVFRL